MQNATFFPFDVWLNELHNGSGGSIYEYRIRWISFERMQLKQQTKQMEAKYYSLRICNYERNGDSR